MAITDTPSVAGFITFLRAADIAPEYLPDASPDITDAYAVAQAWVAQPISTTAPPPLYALALYNFGTDYLINYASDQPGRTYFKDLRTSYSISLFVPGVTASSGDSGTSQSRLNPKFMEQLTFGDLQMTKTPYGRAYMNIAQQYGSVWGIS